MKDKTYECKNCGKDFESDWSDEEAIKESEDLFGVKNANENHDIVIVCDDCFKKLMKGRK